MAMECARKPSLLVVDDEASIRFVLSEYFTGRGWSVVCASSRDEGMKLLEGPAFDVAVLDLRLTKGDQADAGIALLEEIVRRRPQTRNILLTGYGCQASRQAALARGAAEVLDKPVRLEVLLAVAARLIEERDRQALAVGE
jgi:DNA-binding NtrC family response regulator